MAKKNNTSKTTAQCTIQNVVCSTWRPTMQLRWREDDWNATLTDFDKTLEQMWVSDTGEEKWKEVPLA